MSEDDVGQDDNAFFKALPSDVDDGVSLKLLTEVYESNDMWSEFQEDDIAQVVEVFSVLNMAPGDKLITKGEYATFCGVILQGTFNAIVTPTFTVPLRAGDVIGEMALFEGGARNADIITGTDPEGCILAVITFVDLDNLAMNERYSNLARKLTMMFATASIKKLRGMLKPAGPTPATAGTTNDANATPAVATDASTAGSTTSPTAAGGSTAAISVTIPTSPTSAVATTSAVPPTPTTAAAAAGSSVVPAKKERVKKAEKKPVVAETLYKNKMNKASSSTNADGTLISPKNINEAQRVLEENQWKLKKVEHAKRNQQVMMDRLTKQIKAAEEQLTLKDDSLNKTTNELKNSQDSLKETNAKIKELNKSIEELNTNLEKERKSRVDIEAKLTSTHQDFSSKTTEEFNTLRTELDTVSKKKHELETALAAATSLCEELKQSKELESNKAVQSQSELSSTTERMNKDLSVTRSRAETLELDLRNQIKHNDEQRLSLSGANMRILDLEEKLSAAMSWKLKALEFQSGLDAEKKRHIRLSDDWSKLQKELETELKHYKLLLKTFAITIYAKEFRLRKLIGQLHKRVSEMLLTTLEEHYNTSTGKEKAAAKIGTSAGNSGVISSASSASTSGLSSSSSAASTSTTFKSVRKRKKAYLDNLLKPTSKLRDVVTSLDDEVSKLKGPFEEIRERCLHWRATSESFFQRNIDLASKLMTLDKNLIETTHAKEHLDVTVREKSKEMERLSQKHADLSARYISNAGGSSNNSNSSSNANHEGNSKESQAVSSKLNATRQEIEMLEARSTVLRVHIQQLEAHYLSLQHAIHSFTTASATTQESKENGAAIQLMSHGGPYMMNNNNTTTNGMMGENRFDPALVSSIPFPTYLQSNLAANTPHPPTQPSSSTTIIQPASSPRGAIVLAPNRNAVGGGMIYHPPSSASSSSSANQAMIRPMIPTAAPYLFNPHHHQHHPVGLPINQGPTSPKPDVISLRALREQQQLVYLQQQQQLNNNKFPPLAAAASNVITPPAGPTAIIFPSPPTNQPMNHTAAIAVNQNRTQLTFTPRSN